jgi:hypothetical protein
LEDKNFEPPNILAGLKPNQNILIGTMSSKNLMSQAKFMP